MFKPHRAVCRDCHKDRLLVVKAGRCALCQQIYNREKKGLSKKVPPIKKVSDKKAAQDVLYKVIHDAYLKAHPKCEIQFKGCTNISSEIHHIYSGSNRSSHYLDDTTFKASCRFCHSFLHDKMSAEELILRGLKK